MILKDADDRSTELEQLRQYAKSSDAEIAKTATAELRTRTAGANNEDNAAYYIDFAFAKTRNWIVVHDLRLESHGRTAQIDHLLICRTLDFYVLESKHFRSGVKITETGEFMRWDEYRKSYSGMESPIEQNTRHIDVLRDVLAELPMPERLGMRLRPTFHSLILVSPRSRIIRPEAFDTSMVIKADQIRQRIDKDTKDAGTIESFLSVGKLISSQTLRDVGELLVGQHRQVPWPLPPALAAAASTKLVSTSTHKATGQAPHVATSPAMATQPLAAPPRHRADGPTCKQCGGDTGSIQYGRYGYYFHCAACDSNTAIRFACAAGHHPRLRKAGESFYRDCPECKSSEVYFVNP